jgi:predicted Zn-dependent peptidase
MDRTKQPDIKRINNIVPMSPERIVMGNGVPVFRLNAAEQEVVRLDLVFKGGRWCQSRKLQSLFTNRMLREGTSRFSAQQIAEALDYYGAWLELSSSADHEYITLYSLCKYFDRTLELVESMVKEPAFPEHEFGVVVDINRSQWLVNMTKMDFLARRELVKNMYGEKHPCGRLVRESDYTTLTTLDLRSFHEANYSSERCAIFVSGRVTDDIMARIERSFGAESFGGGANRVVNDVERVITPSGERRLFVERPEARQNSLKIGQFTIGRKHEDYLKYRVLLELFGGYFGCRLMANIREDKGYTYGISATVSHQPDSSTLFIDTETDGRYVENVISEINHEITRLHSEAVSAEELGIVKNYMIGEMCRSYDSPFSLADLWAFVYASDLPDDYLERSLRAIEETTAEDIRTLAQRYLRPEEMYISVAGAK